MKFPFLLAVILLFTASVTSSQFCSTPAARDFYNRALKTTNQKHLQFFHAVATDLRSGKTQPAEIREEVSRYTSRSGFSEVDIDAMIFFILAETAKNTEDELRESLAKMKELNEKKQDQRKAIALLKKRAAERSKQLRSEFLSRSEFDSLRRGLATATVIRSVPIAIPGADTLRRILDNKNVVQNGAVQRIDPNRFPVSGAEFGTLLDGYRDKIDALNEMSEEETLRMQSIMDRLNNYYSSLSNLFQKINNTQDSIIDNLK